MLVCIRNAFAAQQPDPEDNQGMLHGQIPPVENYTLKYHKKKIDNSVHDFENIEEEVQDEVESIANKVKDNAIIACIIVSNSAAPPMKKGPNIVEKTTIDHDHDKEGQSTYKKYILGNHDNTGLIAKKRRNLAQKLGYHIIQTEPSHIILSVSQLLATNKKEKNLFHIATNKPICNKCYYLLRSIIGYKKEIEHKEGGCNNKELTWPIPEAAENYIDEYIVRSKRPLREAETILAQLKEKAAILNTDEKEETKIRARDIKFIETGFQENVKDHKKFFNLYKAAVKHYGNQVQPLDENNDDARIYIYVGLIYRYGGKYDNAIESHKEALNISLTVVGKQHQDTAWVYNNLGITYKKQGKYHQAIKCFNEALPIRLTLLGRRHEDTAKTYSNLANVYWNQKNYDKAVEHYKEALNIYTAILGKQHTYTADIYYNLGVAYLKKLTKKQAIANLKEALAIRREVLGEQHQDTIASRSALNKCLNK